MIEAITGAGPKWVVRTAAELERSVARLASTLQDASPRPIVVHGRSLSAGDERLVVEWAVQRRGAIAAVSQEEMQSAAIAEAAYWIRPTVLHGSAEELEEWARLFRSGERGGRGVERRFRRLESVLVTGDGELAASGAAFYRRLGARVVELKGAELSSGDRL